MSLSNKRKQIDDYYREDYHYEEEDLKQAIKELKKTIEWAHTDKLGMITKEQINSIFGDKLV